MSEKAKRVLVPFYGTHRPLKAYEASLKQTMRGGKLLLIHIVDDTPIRLMMSRTGYLSEDSDVIRVFKENLEKTQRGEAKKFADFARTKASKCGIKLEILFKTGDPAKEIIEVAKGLDADLIVMERLRKKITHAFFGSIVDYVTRKAPCRVLVVPKG